MWFSCGGRAGCYTVYREGLPPISVVMMSNVFATTGGSGSGSGSGSGRCSWWCGESGNVNGGGSGSGGSIMKSMDEQYDLKGSTVSRTVGEGMIGTPNVTYKDMDWRSFGHRLCVDRRRRKCWSWWWLSWLLSWLSGGFS